METEKTKYTVLESATGDELGVIYIASDAGDEQLIDALVATGFIEPPGEAHMIDDGYIFSEDGQRVVVDSIKLQPVLTLERDAPAAKQEVTPP